MFNIHKQNKICIRGIRFDKNNQIFQNAKQTQHRYVKKFNIAFYLINILLFFFILSTIEKTGKLNSRNIEINMLRIIRIA